MQDRGTPPLQDELGSFATEEEELARRSSARMLITAVTAEGAEALARRIHDNSARGELPFCRIDAARFPVEWQQLKDICGHLLEETNGGTLFINNVEQLPRAVQDGLLDLILRLETDRGALGSVRVISATTVSLFDRVNQGQFSESLFYRLNLIHLVSRYANEAVQPES